MNKFFGKKKDDKETPADALKKLKDIKDMLDKKQLFLEKKIENEIQTAKGHGMKNKRAALQALAKKKRLEKQLQQLDGILTTIEFQIEAVESASTNAEILKAMRQASVVLKASHQNMLEIKDLLELFYTTRNVDKINEMMDDLADQHETSKEIAEAISSPVGFDRDIDEAELLAELEMLQEEDLKADLLKISKPESVKLPNVPDHEPQATSKVKSVKEKNNEDKELEELQNWAT